MESREIRDRFLTFFKELDHTVLPGSSLVPEEPNLLLTTAGMVQFIPYFRGDRKAEHKRVATVQRCLRTTDIDRIGHTARHLSFFEMLGNFSFGDYYKKEVIPWAWRFVTEELEINPGHLWVSIFLDDDESFEIWHKDVGLSPNRIVRLGEDENFWSMGATGPCGPCSEIHYDFGADKACGPDCAVGCDCDRFIEVWNLVFMQYNRDENGELSLLPKKNIDTGMGLERVAAITQGGANNFESDLLKGLIDEIGKLGKAAYGQSEADDISLKIVADHARAVTFMINDGVLPSNEGRGYVLRRLIRRAVRHGRQLGIDKPFLSGLAHKVIDDMSEAYPDVGKNRSFIEEIIKDEEDRFRSTLKAGLAVLDDLLKRAAAAGANTLDAESVFKLYDTYGFPPELTCEIAGERNLGVDTKAVEKRLEKHKELAKAAAGETVAAGDVKIFAKVLEASGETSFEGYGDNRTTSLIVAIIKSGKRAKQAGEGDNVEIILKATPFYAEMGGQVGDDGVIETATGIVEVGSAVLALPGLTTHKGRVKRGTIKEGQEATAEVDAERRQAIRRNHTATHILHWALRMILGEHVRQGGSHVNERRLRFDFTHGRALSGKDLARLETLVNKRIMEDNPVRAYTTTYKYAVESGALAFFGEKYGKNVRVLEVGDFSRELCGGTHIARTGQIGQFKIIAESSIGANLRRVEAVTGAAALDIARDNETLLSEVETKLKTSRNELAGKVDNLLKQLRESEKLVLALKAKEGSSEAAGLIDNAEDLNGIKLVIAITPNKKPEELRSITDEIRNRLADVAIALGSVNDEGASLILAFSQSLAGERMDAVEMIREAAPRIGGGGGGRPDLAQAGGKNADGLNDAMAIIKEAVKKRLS